MGSRKPCEGFKTFARLSRWGWLSPGGLHGLQNRWEALKRLRWVRLPSTPESLHRCAAHSSIFSAVVMARSILVGRTMSPSACAYIKKGAAHDTRGRGDPSSSSIRNNCLLASMQCAAKPHSNGGRATANSRWRRKTNPQRTQRKNVPRHAEHMRFPVRFSFALLRTCELRVYELGANYAMQPGVVWRLLASASLSTTSFDLSQECLLATLAPHPHSAPLRGL